MVNLIESGIIRFREWRRTQDPASAYVLSEYRSKGGIIIGGEEEPYRLKVTPDGMKLQLQNPEQPITEAEKERIQSWLQRYLDAAMLAQRHLRVALGYPADIPRASESPDAK